MRQPLWEIDHVLLRGSGRNRLDGVTCRIPGGVTAILGESGAGKTSLLNLLAGLDQPDAGRLQRQFDTAGGELPLYWAPQGGGLWPHLTVRQHLTELGKDGESTDKLLEGFGLNHRGSAVPLDLSQGEQARLSVARALAVRARVLLFDEPLVHVNGDQKQQGWNLIRNHIQSTGTHLVLTTHEPDIVLREADSVICLQEGKLVWEGRVSALYDGPPDAPTGRFLGPLNWIVAADIPVWSTDSNRPIVAGCVRPERLQLIPVEADIDRSAGGLGQVVRSDFAGTHAETTIHSLQADVERTFVHRPQHPLIAGQTVMVRIHRAADDDDV